MFDTGEKRTTKLRRIFAAIKPCSHTRTCKTPGTLLEQPGTLMQSSVP